MPETARHVSAPPSSAQLDDLAAELCRLGRRAGLDAVGICDTSPFHEALASLNQGRQRGWNAGMQFTYRNPARSTDPSRALPGARAMVVGARRYDRRPPDDRHAPAGSRPKGAVARYAWEDHYRTLRSALNEVAERLRAQGWRATVLVDDNALVDRAAAVRAGLGWYGKNTNVLIPGAGSWFVLGSVVTDAPLLESGQERPTAHTPGTLTPGPVEDGCGACRRCIDACPTGALTHDEPGHLDANKCLAWLVQAPGIFPREYRAALHDRMYGCDDCQEACPVNRIAQRREAPPQAADDALTSVDVLDVLNASNEELLETLGRWYIPNRDPRYLRRNALIVLGNTADPNDPQVRSAIRDATVSPDLIIRAHAIWAAARLGHHDLVPTEDPDPHVQAEIDATRHVTIRTVTA